MMPVIALEFCDTIIKTVAVRDGYPFTYRLAVSERLNFNTMFSECRTCGQPLPPKVTMYKLVFEYHGKRTRCKECARDTVPVYEFAGIET